MGQRLLVVDSDRSFLKEHQVSLEAAFDVDVSPVPDGALPKLESGVYAAALICVEVAENKGYALCSAIRKNPVTANLKIALISAKATEEEYRRHQSLKGRADLYLHKPLAPGALVAALSQVVPPRSVDPDNPLGDLTGDLGEDWLDSLKDELDGGVPPAPPTPAPTHQTIAISMDMLKQAGLTPQAASPKSATAPIPVVPQASGKTMAISMEQLRESLAKPPEPSAPKPPDRTPELEAKIRELETELETRANSMEMAEAEIERLSTELELSRKAEATATRNLDEAERLKAELDQLHVRVKDREEALQRTREDYEALQRSHDSITQNLDDLERRQKESEELRGKLAKAEEELARLEQSSLKEGEGSEALKVQLRQSIEEHHDLLQQVEQLNNQMADKNQRVIGLLKERDRLQQQALEAENQQNRVIVLERERQELDAALSDIRTRHDDLERAHQELGSRHQETQHRAEDQAGRVQALERDLEGKEATLRAQGRDLAGLEARLKAVEGEAEGLRNRVAELESALRTQEEASAQLQGSKERLLVVATDLERQLGKMVGQHEAERLELLQGLDAKESELGRVQATLDAFKQSVAGLEVEVSSLQSALADRTDRLGALAALLGELGERIQRGADLTKA